jgi:hypothetical protein
MNVMERAVVIGAGRDLERAGDAIQDETEETGDRRRCDD